MHLSFLPYRASCETGVSRAAVVVDEAGNGRALVVAWQAALIPLVRERHSVIALDGATLTAEQMATLTRFAQARLDTGLELEGVTVEV